MLEFLYDYAWMTRSPATALQHFGIVYDDHDPRFGNAFIDKEMFEVLSQSEPDPQRFWELRADRLANRLYSLQYISKNVSFDIGGDGPTEPLPWTRSGSDDLWLALDRNGNGVG